MKKLLHEFKTFISKGNVIDMAVGIIIGSAFTAIVNSLVKDVLTPAISLVFGSIDFSYLKIPQGAADGEAAVLYGSFLTAVINFLLVAVCVFALVKVVNSVRGLKKKEEATVKPKRLCPFCRMEIADDATRCPHCTSETPIDPPASL